MPTTDGQPRAGRREWWGVARQLRSAAPLLDVHVPPTGVPATAKKKEEVAV